MLKFLYGISAGICVSIISAYFLVNLSAIRFNTCYLTESSQKVAFGGALWVDESWLQLGNNDRYDFILVGKLKPCPVPPHGEAMR